MSVITWAVREEAARSNVGTEEREDTTPIPEKSWNSL